MHNIHKFINNVLISVLFLFLYVGQHRPQKVADVSMCAMCEKIMPFSKTLTDGSDISFITKGHLNDGY